MDLMIIRPMKTIGAQGNHPGGRVTPHRLLAVLALVIAAPLAAGGCGFKTAPRPAVEALPPTGDFQVRQRGDALLVSWRAVEPEAAGRFGGVRGYRFVLQRHPVFCGVCPPESTRTVRVRADGKALRREGGRIAYRLSGRPGAGDTSGPGPALLRVRMITLYGSGENRPTAPALLEPPAPMAAPRLMWRWMDARQMPSGLSAAPGLRVAQLYWKARREGVLRVIGSGGRPSERKVFLRANLYRRVPPAPWPLTPLNPEPLDTGRWRVTHSRGAGENAAPEPGGVEYVLRWIDRFGNEGPPSQAVRIGRGEESR